MRRRSSYRDESGIALVSALLVLLLMSSLMIGFSAMATTDTRVRAISGSRTQAFYFAHAGLEKLTADIGDLFLVNTSPSGAQIDALVANPPEFPGVTWVEGDGDSGYRIDFPRDADGNPLPGPGNITSGPFQGFRGQIVDFTMEVTAHLTDGSEAQLRKEIQTVAIPLFQFGMFSEMDLSFFPGPSFNFGGRVHTNGNLFLAADPGPVSFSDPVTVLGEVIRTELANGQSTAASHSGNVRVRTSTNAYRMLNRDEGSLVGGLGTAENEPTWTNLSTGVYNYNIRNWRTGAKRLELPIVTAGASVIDLIRRPMPSEDTNAPEVLAQRYFSMASLRILLSDEADDITSLPTVTATPPVELGAVTPVGYDPTNPDTPPFALSAASGTNGSRTTVAGTPLLGGFLKVEMQRTDGTWQDVTLEILNFGIAGEQWRNPTVGGSGPCAGVPAPSPNAVLRIQRVRDNDGACLTGSLLATDYWPNVLYDPREGIMRDGFGDNTPPNFGGVMHYLELDTANLKRWFEGTLPGSSGSNAMNIDGYVVYFSDRRGNRNDTNDETGEYGFEDVVNTPSGGVPNRLLDAGEDVNGNGLLDEYGRLPRFPLGGMDAPYHGNLRPNDRVDADNDNFNDTVDQQIARANPAVFFRRALKVSNGAVGNVPMPGLTLVSENPVYINGTWNADPSSGFVEPNAATAFIADAITLLSDVFSDRVSFLYAHNLNPRNGNLTYFRFAGMSGKGLSFPRPAGTPNDFGTDGGTHNFLRYIEDWNGNTLRYMGSLASMFYSRQAVGTYKCCADVYGPPTRGYEFDLDFLEYGLLPPRTPMFRDVNSTGFTQIIRPR